MGIIISQFRSCDVSVIITKMLKWKRRVERIREIQAFKNLNQKITQEKFQFYSGVGWTMCC
jgi:hypothetical protein